MIGNSIIEYNIETGRTVKEYILPSGNVRNYSGISEGIAKNTLWLYYNGQKSDGYIKLNLETGSTQNKVTYKNLQNANTIEDGSVSGMESY